MQSFNPLVEGYQDHLYEIYRHFREKDPVHRASEGSPSMGAWYVFRYSDVSFVLKDPRFVREYAVAVGSATETVETSAATSARRRQHRRRNPDRSGLRRWKVSRPPFNPSPFGRWPGSGCCFGIRRITRACVSWSTRRLSPGWWRDSPAGSKRSPMSLSSRLSGTAAWTSSPTLLSRCR